MMSGPGSMVSSKDEAGDFLADCGPKTEAKEADATARAVTEISQRSCFRKVMRIC